MSIRAWLCSQPDTFCPNVTFGTNSATEARHDLPRLDIDLCLDRRIETMANYPSLQADIDNWYASASYFDWQGSRICYQHKGAGPVLLMVHGFPTAGCDWCDMAKGLAEHFTIIAPDIADAGQSANPTRQTYTLHEHADMLEALLKHLDFGSAHLLGHDVGDAICQELIARQNEQSLGFLIQSCVFLNGGILMKAHRPRFLQSRLAGRYGEWIARFLPAQPFMKTISNIFGERKPGPEALRTLWSVSTGINGRASLARRSQNMHDRRQHAGRWVRALQETDIPLCMINGVMDPISGAHACEAIEREIPAIELIRLEGVGHFPLIEAPQQCVEHLLSFHRRLGLKITVEQ
ncbi:alpha/beta hydrolase [Congregibacter variabilis]|uniref:Alpha/beta hydrolase n=1 Tax=Congregibacter variabilis TaxID=3081200 RepID=A0ABZ0I6C2_9GAMM|nr:alpha/beta hydrolase [Congregibacter sp. IMCC43200]